MINPNCPFKMVSSTSVNAGRCLKRKKTPYIGVTEMLGGGLMCYTTPNIVPLTKL